jgi:hypothetical protein
MRWQLKLMLYIDSLPLPYRVQKWVYNQTLGRLLKESRSITEY